MRGNFLEEIILSFSMLRLSNTDVRASTDGPFCDEWPTASLSSFHLVKPVTSLPTLPVSPPFPSSLSRLHRAVFVWFNDHHTARPGMIHGSLPPLACAGGHMTPVLPVVPATGAPSPHPRCSPPVAALHLHLLAPSMPSPRSQLSHTAHYPTATHHPSKSGSIHVSPVTQCDVMLYSLPPSPAQTPAWWALMHGSLFSVPHVVRAKAPSVAFTGVFNLGLGNIAVTH